MKEKTWKRNVSVLGYMTNLYFSDHKLAIEIDENGHSEKNIQYKIKRQKAIEQEPGCEFIRIDDDKEGLDIYEAINKRFRHIKHLIN